MERFIREQCKKTKILNYHIILLEQLTDGQATTASLAEKYWNPDHALLNLQYRHLCGTRGNELCAVKRGRFYPVFSGGGRSLEFCTSG